jgi:hypothetical protein
LNKDSFRVIRKINVNSVEPPVPDPSPYEAIITIGKLKRYKSPGSDQNPTELIHAREMRSINSIIPLGMRKNCLITHSQQG